MFGVFILVVSQELAAEGRGVFVCLFLRLFLPRKKREIRGDKHCERGQLLGRKEDAVWFRSPRL